MTTPYIHMKFVTIPLGKNYKYQLYMENVMFMEHKNNIIKNQTNKLTDKLDEQSKKNSHLDPF